MGVEFWTSAMGAGPRRVAELAADMEAAGWDGVGIVDSQNLATDPFVFLSLAAQATERLELMTSVTNVVTRHPAVMASSALTVQSVSRGRFALGIGRGDSALAHIGRAPARVAWFERYLETVRTYLHGGDVAMQDLPMSSDIAPPVEELALAHRPDASRIAWAHRLPVVPIVVAATGPKVIAAAARHADRILFALGADPDRIRWGIGAAHEAAEAAGRDSGELRFGMYVTVVCHDDVSKARSIGRGSTSLFARFSAMHGSVSAPADETQKQVFEAVHRSYDMNRHARADGAQTAVLSDEFMETFAVLGSVERCIDRLGELADLGVDQFNVSGASVASSDPEHVEAASRLIQRVAPEVRSR